MIIEAIRIIGENNKRAKEAKTLSKILLASGILYFGKMMVQYGQELLHLLINLIINMMQNLYILKIKI
jgi:hypothetical protein